MFGQFVDDFIDVIVLCVMVCCSIFYYQSKSSRASAFQFIGHIIIVIVVSLPSNYQMMTSQFLSVIMVLLNSIYLYDGNKLEFALLIVHQYFNISITGL